MGFGRAVAVVVGWACAAPAGWQWSVAVDPVAYGLGVLAGHGGAAPVDVGQEAECPGDRPGKSLGGDQIVGGHRQVDDEPFPGHHRTPG